MSISRNIAAIVVIALFSIGRAAPAPALDPATAAAEGALKSKGLTRVASQYLVAEDINLRDPLKTMRQAKRQLDDNAKKRGMLEAQLKDMDNAISSWQAQYRVLNEQIAHAKGTIEHNQLAGQINVLASSIEEGQKVREQRGKELSKLVDPRDDYVTAVIALSDQMETAVHRYEELAKDEAVTRAIAQINTKTKPPVKLGPSAQLLQEMQSVRKQREAVDSAVIKLEFAGGVPHADVELNGDVTERMVVDSGAAVVQINWPTARRLGLKPGKDDPSIKLVTANGSVTEARLMKLDSVRLGQFTVVDVECAVLPPDIKGADGLLGGTFLKHFVSRMDLAAGELHLSQVSGKASKADMKEKRPTKPETKVNDPTATEPKETAAKGKAGQKPNKARGSD